MRKAERTITFEPKGVAKLIREAPERREHRLITPQGSIMERLVLETLGGRRAAWRLHYDHKAEGRRFRRKLKIGDQTTDVGTVRERWRAALAKIETGADPVGDNGARRILDGERSAMTFNKLAIEYLAAKETAGNRSLGECRRMLNKDVLPALGRRPVSAITAMDVESIIERITARGSPVAARATHVLIQAVFTWARGTARWRAAGLPSNPAEEIKKAPPPAPKRRKLADEELRALWCALDDRAGIEAGTAEAFRLVLLLARRSKEVLAAEWREMELARPDPIWRLPAVRSKNKKEIVIPLSSAAVEMLSRLHAENAANPEASAYVFPGTVRAKPLSPGVLRKALARMFEVGRLSSPTYSTHDLRRTVAHRCAEDLDFSGEIIAAFLGHVAGNVTDAHYSQASKVNRTRRLAEAWAAHLARIVAGNTEDNVVPLRSHG